jgi:hypothetical protein
MGRKHRIVTGAALCALSLAAVSCKNDAQERAEDAKRALLRAHDLEAQRSARIAAQRLTDDAGNLLPSATDVVGLVIPRGFSVTFTEDHEWYYDGEHPVGKVEKYFDERLDAMVNHPYPNATTYRHATMKTKTKMDPMTVNIFPMPGRTDWTRIHIVANRPQPDHFPTPAEIEAHLAAQRENYN